MSGSIVLALDQGTTSSRAIVFDDKGSILGSDQQEFRQHYPRPGWVEHDPRDIWETQRNTMEGALTSAGITPDQVAAIGITNQRETTLLWEASSGRPVGHAIVWQDRRTADMCRRLKNEGHEDTFNRKTGLFLDPYFSGTKIRWMMEHHDGLRGRAENGEVLFGTVDSWLVWNLTGGKVHATDITNASRTLLCNIHEGSWDDELLAILDIPRAMLPEIRSCSEVYGKVDQDLPLKGIPIAGIAGDQQAALFGQACFRPGMAKNTYGTGCFLLMQTGETAIRSGNNLLTTVAWSLNGKTNYALEGSVFIGGAVIQWLRDELQIIESAPRVNELAAGVEDNGGVYLVPAFTGLGAPHWDPYARGVMVGLTRGANRGHIARAALESIAFQSADLMEAMAGDAGMPVKELRVDGGAAASDLLMQIQTDLVGVDVVRPRVTETTAFGAACLAGLAAGVWDQPEDIERHWQPEKTFHPEQTREEAAEAMRQWRRAVERSRAWIEEDDDAS